MKNLIVQANLRLVVSYPNGMQHGRLFALVSDGICRCSEPSKSLTEATSLARRKLGHDEELRGPFQMSLSIRIFGTTGEELLNPARTLVVTTLRRTAQKQGFADQPHPDTFDHREQQIIIRRFGLDHSGTLTLERGWSRIGGNQRVD